MQSSGKTAEKLKIKNLRDEGYGNVPSRLRTYRNQHNGEGGVYATLGDGGNTVSVDGTVGGDLNVVRKNQADTVTIDDQAMIAGDTNLGLGEQSDHSAHSGHSSRHHRGHRGNE